MENYKLNTQILLSIKNNYKNDIRTLEKLLENTQKTRVNLSNQKASTFIVNKVEKLLEKEEKIKSDITELKKKVKLIGTGALDNEIKKQLFAEKKKLEEKINVKKRRKKEETNKSEARSKIAKQFYEKNRQSYRKQKYNERGWISCYNYYVRTSDKLPNYMKNNLKNMPNNKGYFWRDIAFYGEKPPEKNNPTVLFQRERDGSMIIHEWTPSHYNKYYKKTKASRKKLISSIPRIKNNYNSTSSI